MKLPQDTPGKTKDIPLKVIGDAFGISGNAYTILTTLKDRGYTYEMILMELQRQKII